MGAEFADQADAAVGIAECDELLAQQLHTNRRAVALGDFFGQDRGHPVAPEEISEQRAVTGSSELIVLFLVQRHKSLLLPTVCCAPPTGGVQRVISRPRLVPARPG